MGIFDDQLAIDGALAFTDTDWGAEVVTYKPKAGGTRPINAQMERFSPAIETDNPRVKVQMRAQVCNSTTKGVAWSEVSTGGTISVAYRPGGTAQDYQIRLTGEIAQDAAMLYLDLF